MDIKSIFKDWRILVFFVILIIALGYDIFSITNNKLEVLNSPVLPNGTYIYSINGCPVNSLPSYYSCIQQNINSPFLSISTSKGNIVLQPSQYNYLINETNLTQISYISYGIDIAGGYLLILNSTKPLTPQELSIASQVIENRLNSFGVKSINIYPTSEGYIIVELPYSEGYLIPYIVEQGTFYAKIGNETVFTGSEVKPLFGGQYSGLLGCSPAGNQYVCQYFFTLILSPQAANNFAQATKNLSVVFEDGGAYLSEPIVFYLDNQNVSSLLIAADLKGQSAQQVSIQVSGVGNTMAQAEASAYQNAYNLYIILENGQLPAKFNIVEESEIPPIFGQYILKSLELSMLLIFVGIIAILFPVYRKIKVPLLITLTLVSEFAIAFAIGVAIHQTYDIPAFIGIIFGTATGIDDQLVATEEILRAKYNNEKKEPDILDKAIKKAMFIILLAIILEIISVFPAFVAGLALYKGFAVMVIITVGIGYLLTRPAFINLAKRLL
ncbi:protein translocase subunit SecD [Nanoarchaeota archaeon]